MDGIPKDLPMVVDEVTLAVLHLRGLSLQAMREHYRVDGDNKGRYEIPDRRFDKLAEYGVPELVEHDGSLRTIRAYARINDRISIHGPDTSSTEWSEAMVIVGGVHVSQTIATAAGLALRQLLDVQGHDVLDRIGDLEVTGVDNLDTSAMGGGRLCRIHLTTTWRASTALPSATNPS